MHLHPLDQYPFTFAGPLIAWIEPSVHAALHVGAKYRQERWEVVGEKGCEGESSGAFLDGEGAGGRQNKRRWLHQLGGGSFS